MGKKNKTKNNTANQTVLKGGINFTGRGAASAREGGVEGWDTLGLLERGSGTPRVALQGREHSPEGALLFPIVNVSLQLAERAHGAAQHRVVVTQDGALMRKCHQMKNPLWLSTRRATQHHFPPQPTTNRDVVAGAVQRPHGHAAATQAELVHGVGHLAAQAGITEGSTDACEKRREVPSSQPDPGQGGSTATTNIPSGETQDMGLMPTHRRCSQTCSPTAPCATCWAVGVQRSQAGLSLRDGWPWSGLCTECPGRKAGGEGRKEGASSLSNSKAACFFSSIFLPAPHPATISQPSSPSSSPGPPMLLQLPCSHSSQPGGCSLYLTPTPPSISHTHLPQNSST